MSGLPRRDRCQPRWDHGKRRPRWELKGDPRALLLAVPTQTAAEAAAPALCGEGQTAAPARAATAGRRHATAKVRSIY